MMRFVSRILLQALRGDRMSEFRRLEQNQWQPPSLLEEERCGLVTDMLRHATRSVSFYRDFCAGAGLDPSTVTHEDLHRFPLVAKAILTDRRDEFLDPGAPPSSFVRNFTGGSTGEPFRFFSDRSALVTRKANDMRTRAWTGWRPGDKQANLWAHPRDHEATGGFDHWVRIGLIQRMKALNAYDMDDASIAAFHRELKSYRPALLIGYASSLAFLAEYLDEHGMRMPPPGGIISSAETLTEGYREAIEGYFGCPVHNRYGSREFGVMAQQCEELGGMHILEDRVHLELLDPQGRPCGPGERGEIVVTDLHNAAMPFIRYRTGDVARLADGRCACGRGFRLLEAVEGRTSELLVGKNGKYFSCLGPRFFGADAPQVRRMQVVQDSVESVEIIVVPDGEWRPEHTEWFARRTREILGEVTVTVRQVERIPRTASGKAPFTISKVAVFDRGEHQ